MRIEDLIKRQRDQLDFENPSPEIWDGIKNEWKKETQASFHWWKVAAIIFISTSVALLIYTLSLQSKVNQLASLGDISENYREVENQYQSEISILETKINIQEVSQNDDFQWMIDEMKTLDEINELYRQDIGKAPDQDQLVKALIDYYEKKIKLLKKLELEITRTQKFKEDEKNNTDTVSI
jgi:hypothetical protein